MLNSEPGYFNYIELGRQYGDDAGKLVNLQKIADSIENMLLETACLWTGPKENISRLELIVRQTIGVALKSNRSEAYIERLMALDEES